MNERQRNILKLLADEGNMSVKRLTDIMDVSGVTIRQDLDTLQDHGFLRRVHGGAVLQTRDELSHRLGINYEIKVAIAERAAASIERGETIFIEAGSTNALLARQLMNKSGITVVTNNVFITHTLKDSEVDVILLGGMFQHDSECVVGALTKTGLDALHFSKAFLGVDGVSIDHGFTCADMMRAEISSVVAEKSQNVYVLTDSRKFGTTALYRICRFDQIHELITDEGIPKEIFKGLERAGVTVITVP